MAATSDGALLKIDGENGREEVLADQEKQTVAFALSRDGRAGVTAFEGGGGTVWAMSDVPQAIVEVDPTIGALRRIAFSPSGNSIATVTRDDRLVVMDRTGRVLFERSQPGAMLGVPAFDGAERRITAASERGTIFVWGIDDRKLDAVIPYGAKVKIYTSVFMDDDRSILTTAHDGRVRVWKIGKDVSELIGVARERRPHCLTSEMAGRFGLSISPTDEPSEHCTRLNETQVPEEG